MYKHDKLSIQLSLRFWIACTLGAPRVGMYQERYNGSIFRGEEDLSGKGGQAKWLLSPFLQLVFSHWPAHNLHYCDSVYTWTQLCLFSIYIDLSTLVCGGGGWCICVVGVFRVQQPADSTTPSAAPQQKRRRKGSVSASPWNSSNVVISTAL